MNLVKWSDSLSVGNELMDAHHRVFFEMVKEFAEYPDKNNRDALSSRIAFLVEYTEMHLGAEEELMRRANFPEFESHKAVHDAFVRKVVDIEKAFNNDTGAVTGETVLTLVNNWLVHHILDEDKLYAPYVKKLQA